MDYGPVVLQLGIGQHQRSPLAEEAQHPLEGAGVWLCGPGLDPFPNPSGHIERKAHASDRPCGTDPPDRRASGARRIQTRSRAVRNRA